MDLHIESHEGDIYLAYINHKNKDVLSVSKTGEPLRFRSLVEAKAHFQDQVFDNVWLRHAHVCDEVIGADTGYSQSKILLSPA